MTHDESWRALWKRVPLRGGLGRRILLWFLVLSLVPLFVSNSVGYFVSRGIIDRQIRRYLRALAEVQAQQVSTEVERHQALLEGIAAGNRALFGEIPSAAAAVRAGGREAAVLTEIGAHLAHELEELRSLAELFIIDTDGQVVAATISGRVGEDWSGSELFRQGRAGRYFAADLDRREEDTVPLYRLAVPIWNEQQGRAGVLGGSVRVDEARDFLELPEHPVIDVHAFIVDRRGRPVFFSHLHTPFDFSQPLPSPLIDRPPGSVARYVNYEGVEVVGTSVEVPELPWMFISEVSVASALGQLRGLALLAAAIESIFALLLVAIVWTVARSIVTPLRRLVGGAERIRKGDLGVEVEIERDDELGQLGRAFNQMSSELHSSTRQIRELHEQEMRRAAQLASVGELASGIAHEIKNPLVGMASGVDLLSKEIGENSKAAAILGQLYEQVRRIESAIQDLLSYASPKEPLLTWTNPKLLVERVIALVRPQADAAGVRIEEEHAESLPTIRVDPELLTQALVNLAINAIQAMEPGGLLRVSLASSDDTLRVSISDTGAGIHSAEVERIYRPFYTTKHRGTGLGLAITRGIVERHGGRIEIESAPGEGTTFTLIIPSKAQEALVR